MAAGSGPPYGISTAELFQSQDFKDKLNELLSSAATKSLEAVVDRFSKRSFEKAANGNSFFDVVMDLDATAAKQITNKGFGLIYLLEGSASGGRISIVGGPGRWANMAPGDAFFAPFEHLVIEKGSLAPVAPAGDAHLLIITDPEVVISSWR